MSGNQEGTRFWKVFPGKGGSKWTVFRDRGFVAITATESIDLGAAAPTTRDDLRTKLLSFDELTDAQVRSVADPLWTFYHDIALGDFVCAYGNKRLLGWGKITGGYEFVQDALGFPHRRTVAWQATIPQPISGFESELSKKLTRPNTIVELTREDAAVIRNDGVADGSSDIETRQRLDAAFAASGLSYTPWQIATFYTALQTKGFVILSGISGTGKSKLVQAFAALLQSATLADDNSIDDEAEGLDFEAPWISSEMSDSGTAVGITARKYMLQHKFFVVPKAAYSFFNPPLAGTSGEIDFFYGDQRQRCRLRHRFVKGGPQTLLELIFQGPLRAWFASHVSIGNQFAITPERLGVRQVGVRLFTGDHEPAPQDAPKPQVPTLSIAQDLALSRHDVSDVLFLPVRPDWRDSKSLLGYHNPLTNRYEWTLFLRFLLQAKASYEAEDGLAWFLILDEMNLAHVEHYFADLLSVLESGRDEAGWTREPLRLAVPNDPAGFDLAADPDLPPPTLKLPPNLYLVGTVNVDETIHAFSPKLLDRAFTLDLTEVDFTDYPPVSPSGGIPRTDDDRASSGTNSRPSTGLSNSLARQSISTSSHKRPPSQRHCRRRPISLNPAFS